ncbi:hypothetical protein GE09DRAFT_618024 [Coniochaeta sp. 2T2.1]|nr:hypothetical protein GE09DRAFT_618024 [Coniochaeta sp. 2T2.1]
MSGRTLHRGAPLWRNVRLLPPIMVPPTMKNWCASFCGILKAVSQSDGSGTIWITLFPLSVPACLVSRPRRTCVVEVHPREVIGMFSALTSYRERPELGETLSNTLSNTLPVAAGLPVCSGAAGLTRFPPRTNPTVFNRLESLDTPPSLGSYHLPALTNNATPSCTWSESWPVLGRLCYNYALVVCTEMMPLLHYLVTQLTKGSGL